MSGKFLFCVWVEVVTPHGRFNERFFGVGATEEEGWEDVQREFYSRNERLGFLVLQDLDRGEWCRRMLELSADNPLLEESKRRGLMGWGTSVPATARLARGEEEAAA